MDTGIRELEGVNLYGVYGTGTHAGSSMYPLESTNWEGIDCLQCITGKNGITIIDLQFNQNNSKHFVGWFLGMDRRVLDAFEQNIPNVQGQKSSRSFCDLWLSIRYKKHLDK